MVYKFPDEKAKSDKLLKVYNVIKREENRVFMKVDFFCASRPYLKDALNTLIKLGLIEEVNVTWEGGKKIRRRGKGYKLIRGEGK